MSSTHADPQFPAMGQPEAQALLYAKMSKVLAAVQRVPKNGVNQHFGYRFVREADLTEAIRQHMAEHNLCLFVGATESVDTRPTDGKAGPVTTVKMTATFACGDGGATFTTSWLGAGQDPGDKGLYKALTGGVKYLLMKTFMVSSNDDPEQEEAQGEAARASSHPAGPRRHETEAIRSEDPGDFIMPFGNKAKGQAIRFMDTADLMSALQWARDKGKYREFQAAANEWLATLVTPSAVPLGARGAA